MRKIAERLLLFLLCVSILPDLITSLSFRPVVLMLFAFLYSAGTLAVSGVWKYVPAACFLVLSFFYPDLSLFFPLLLYDTIEDKKYFRLSSGLPLFFYLPAADVRTIFLFTVFCILAVCLCLGSNKILELQKQNIKLRDADTEQNLLLQEKNRVLLQKQDYEIYLATLRERNRIAGEIHDNVGHMLTRSILQIGALSTIHKEDRELSESLSEVGETLNLAMNSIRESVHNLHDDAIDLKQVLSESIEKLDNKYEIKLEYDLSPEVPRAVKFCFISTVKEALSNIVKHAEATRIFILLREQPGFYQLSIEDNGKGFSKKEELSEGRGMGLTGMRERVKELQGNIMITGENGCRIFLSIPKGVME